MHDRQFGQARLPLQLAEHGVELCVDRFAHRGERRRFGDRAFDARHDIGAPGALAIRFGGAGNDVAGIAVGDHGNDCRRANVDRRNDVGKEFGRYGDLSTPTTHGEVRDVEPRIRHQYRDRLRT